MPGFKTNLNDEQFIECVKKIGCCVIGQTPDLAPADKEFYALRGFYIYNNILNNI